MFVSATSTESRGRIPSQMRWTLVEWVARFLESHWPSPPAHNSLFTSRGAFKVTRNLLWNAGRVGRICTFWNKQCAHAFYVKSYVNILNRHTSVKRILYTTIIFSRGQYAHIWIVFPPFYPSLCSLFWLSRLGWRAEAGCHFGQFWMEHA